MSNIRLFWVIYFSINLLDAYHGINIIFSFSSPTSSRKHICWHRPGSAWSPYIDAIQSHRRCVYSSLLSLSALTNKKGATLVSFIKRKTVPAWKDCAALKKKLAKEPWQQINRRKQPTLVQRHSFTPEWLPISLYPTDHKKINNRWNQGKQRLARVLIELHILKRQKESYTAFKHRNQIQNT